MPTTLDTAPVRPTANDTGVVCPQVVGEPVYDWRPCWWCGLPLDPDRGETDLCRPCADDLDPLGPGIRVHAVTNTDADYLPWRNLDIGAIAAASIEHQVKIVEEHAGEWARDHDLDDHAAGAYRGTARALCEERCRERLARDIDVSGWAERRHRDRPR